AVSTGAKETTRSTKPTTTSASAPPPTAPTASTTSTRIRGDPGWEKTGNSTENPSVRPEESSPMACWLFKEEPDHYSLEQLFRDKRTVWDGIENNLALIHLRSVRKGDRVLYFHTGTEKDVVGVMEVVKGPYPDPTRDDPRFVVVDVKPVRRLERPVSLAEI